MGCDYIPPKESGFYRRHYEVKSMQQICEDADENKDDSRRLEYLIHYIARNGKHYEKYQVRFMLEHIGNYLDEIIGKIESQKFTKSETNFWEEDD